MTDQIIDGAMELLHDMSESRRQTASKPLAIGDEHFVEVEAREADALDTVVAALAETRQALGVAHQHIRQQNASLREFRAALAEYRQDHLDGHACGPVAGLEGATDDNRCDLCVTADKLLAYYSTDAELSA